MFFGEENIKAKIRKIKPDISNQELEKATTQICEIALFIVRLKIKNNTKPPPEDKPP